MGEVNRFLDALIKHMGSTLEKKDMLKDKELAEAYRNQLLGLKGPTSITRTLTREERFFSELFYSFSEVFKSYQNLLHIEVYINRYGLRGSEITKAEYLRYHIENYLHELYIFRERAKAFLTKVGRLYRDNRRHSEVLSITRPLFSMVAKTFRLPAKARGSHVHKQRYTDDDLDRLDSLELLALHGGKDLEIFRLLYDEHYKRVRKKWKTLVRENNKANRTILNQIMGQVYKIVFDKSQRLQYPNK